MPTLLLYGDKDVRSPLSVGRVLRAQIPTSRLVVIPGAGHVSNLEAPERFNDELRGCLRTAVGGPYTGGAMEQVEVKGLSIAFQTAGDGPPLVLLHGGPSDSRQWRRQLEDLSDEFKLVAWDMPGCGQSSDPPRDWRTRDYADCLAEFMAALGVARPHVLGLSFGSGLALELYRWYPDTPKTLILASAYAGWAGSLPAEVVEQRKQGMLQRIDLPPDRWAREWLPTLVTESASPSVVDELASILASFHPEGQRALLRAGWAEHDARDILPQINVPTLLLYGEKDMRSPLEVAREMHAKILGSKLVVMEGVGHEADMEAPDRFNAEVRRFLRSVQS